MPSHRAMLAALRAETETKSAPDPLAIFREFLMQLDRLQHAAQTAPPKPARRRPSRRPRAS